MTRKGRLTTSVNGISWQQAFFDLKDEPPKYNWQRLRCWFFYSHQPGAPVRRDITVEVPFLASKVFRNITLGYVCTGCGRYLPRTDIDLEL